MRVNTLLSIWAPACSFSEGERRGSGTHSAVRPLATMPARSLQHCGTPVACCISFTLSASRLSPNPHLFLSASIFLSSQRVCPYSQDISSPCRRGAAADCGHPWSDGKQAHQLLQAGSPVVLRAWGHVRVRDSPYPYSLQGRSAGLLRPGVTPPVPCNTPTQAPSSPPAVVRPPYAHITTMRVLQWSLQLSWYQEMISGNLVASGQQQKVRGAFVDYDHDENNTVPQNILRIVVAKVSS